MRNGFLILPLPWGYGHITERHSGTERQEKPIDSLK